MFKGFKEFIMRGNVIDLAVAVVVGTAFGTVITSFVSNVINKLLSAVVSRPDFSAFKLHLGGTDVTYGVFLNDLLGFLLVACAVYIFMVAPMNAWKARAARAVVPADPTHKKCSECLSEIPVAAKRCAFCTSVLTAS